MQRRHRVLLAMLLSSATAAGLAPLAPGAHGSTPSRPAATPKITRQFSPARGSRCDMPPSSPLSYNYPVKPFTSQHPIRGYFGDPRTGPVTAHAVFAPGAPGAFNFHNGIDVVAATGTPVYPVVSGVARIGYADEVIVHTADHRTFQYFHIWPSIRQGQQVVAYKTVLGHLQAGYMHVHLSEIDGYRVHNPLDPGHLGPYQDTTLPSVDGIQFSDARGQVADGLQLRGSVDIAADAHDMPAMPIIGSWPGLGVTPALVVRWGLRTVTGGVVIPEHTVADFRRNEPPNQDFWKVYAAGTHQNDYTAEKAQPFRTPGRYLFRLTPSAIETRVLPNGVYVLTVKVADTCGNRSSLSEWVTVKN
ncbi:MAG: hypothetical protein ACXVZO_03460 [Gaiellaceae bacterium]